MRDRPEIHARVARSLSVLCTCALIGGALSCRSAQTPQQQTFATPEEAVRALTEAAKKGDLDRLKTIFGPEVQDVIDSSDPVTARQNREVFTVAVAEEWHLADKAANTKELVIGHESWPFPVPLVKDGNSWRFDTAAGKEEILARRIGGNELAVMRICQTYVAAQKLYAQHGHDGKPEGLFARAFRSDPGKQNGLYWPVAHGQRRSPLGDLVAQAAEEGRNLAKDQQPAPFHGYYFKILTAQGASAAGGAKDYVVNGDMSGGFALVAWPAHYDATGVMTFVVNQDGVVRQKDLGPETDATAKALAVYNPDDSWEIAQ